MKVRKKVTALAAMSVMAVGALGLAAAPTLAGSVTVKATGSDGWNPAGKTVAKGTTVVWKNPTDDDHNVKAYKGPWQKSSALAEGGSTSFRFSKAGTYKYRCTLHSSLKDGRCEGMCGKIVVR